MQSDMAGGRDLAAGGGAGAGARVTKPWRSYGLSVLFIGVFPLIPVLFELLTKGGILEASLIITAAMYAATIAIASNNSFLFGLFLIASLIEAGVYGSEANVAPDVHYVSTNFFGMTISYEKSTSEAHAILWFVSIVIVFALLTLIVERFVRHVRDNEVFFEFLKGKGG